MAEPSTEHFQLAGMALAHAVWSIEDGETLCTMSMLDDGRERHLARYEADSIEESVEEALLDLKERLVGRAFAALIYDGYYTDDDGDRRDALVVELLAAQEPSETGNTAAKVGRIVQRYEPGKRGLIRRKRVKLLAPPLILGAAPPDAVARVIEGAMEHEKTRDLFETMSA